MAQLELDNMEYATDGAAQAAYVTNSPGSISATDFALSYSAVFYSSQSAGASATNAFDGSTLNRWEARGGFPYIIGVDMGSGVTKICGRYKITSWASDNTWAPKDFKFQGSNNNSTWDDLDTQTGLTWTSSETKTFNITNSTAYRYYRVFCTATDQPSYIELNNINMYESIIGNLQSYSSTTKTQGSYSLKGIAAITDSLNKTLTRTVTIGDLTGVKNLKFDIRASRVGANIKIGLVDAQATTEITPNIITADTFQTINWDISGVPDANKNAITAIIITITNADAANTFYLDNFNIAQAIDIFGMI